MERHHKTLAIVLAVQLLIVAAIWLFDANSDSGAAHELLTLDRGAITAIEVDDRTDSVRIERVDGAWKLPGEEPLPVDEAKVDALLDKLEAADAPWPVATSESSAERFEVTDSNYQRRIRLFEADTVASELFFGTSPGFRKVHARVADTTDVFAVTFANYEAATKADEWLDKTLLQPKGAITSVTRNGAFTLNHEGDVWTLVDPQEGETLNADAARDLTAKLANLRVLGRADPPAADAAALMEFDVMAAEGNVSLRFFRAGDEGDFVVGSDRYGAYFRMSEYVGEGLNIDRGALLVAAPVDDTSATSEATPDD